MMMPKKVKFRKQQRGRRRGMATRGQKISFGDYGLQALEPGWLTARQIEVAGRDDASRHAAARRIRIFPTSR
jgi:large subunit ribosomal protein L16